MIGTLAHASADPVDVVTGDRDLFQLVDDARSVRILYTARGVGRLEVIDETAVTRKYGIPVAPTPTSRCSVATRRMVFPGCPVSATRPLRP